MILITEDAFHHDWYMLTKSKVIIDLLIQDKLNLVVSCWLDHKLVYYDFCVNHVWQKDFSVNPNFGEGSSNVKWRIWWFKNLVQFKKTCTLEDKFLPSNIKRTSFCQKWQVYLYGKKIKSFLAQRETYNGQGLTLVDIGHSKCYVIRKYWDVQAKAPAMGRSWSGFTFENVVIQINFKNWPKL